MCVYVCAYTYVHVYLYVRASVCIVCMYVCVSNQPYLLLVHAFYFISCSMHAQFGSMIYLSFANDTGGIDIF